MGFSGDLQQKAYRGLYEARKGISELILLEPFIEGSSLSIVPWTPILTKKMPIVLCHSHFVFWNGTFQPFVR